MAKYYWTEDGIAETVQVEQQTVAVVCHCYHCGKQIAAGETVTRLIAANGDTYFLHSGCAERSVQG